MSGVWLPVGSLILAIYLVILFYVKGAIKNYETKIYRILILLLYILNSITYLSKNNNIKSIVTK